ncbi:MAG TPA: hypothetical protein VF723_11485 [Pyrinomonadaceae bacterium]|jgi:hypothetical protein
MTEEKGGGWLLVGLGILILASVAYYSETGKGTENDSALIPNNLEDQIDFVVAALNKRFGKRWVDYGFKALESYFKQKYPPVAVLVGLVVNVEQASETWPMPGYAKRQRAIQIAGGA